MHNLDLAKIQYYFVLLTAEYKSAIFKTKIVKLKFTNTTILLHTIMLFKRKKVGTHHKHQHPPIFHS